MFRTHIGNGNDVDDRNLEFLFDINDIGGEFKDMESMEQLVASFEDIGRSVVKIGDFAIANIGEDSDIIAVYHERSEAIEEMLSMAKLLMPLCSSWREVLTQAIIIASS